MIDTLLLPFQYQYMLHAILICAMVGLTCAFLSSFLMLKGWSLMGDALSHSVVPGVVLSYMIGLPYALGAFFTGLLAALSMAALKIQTPLREDAIIGLVFTSFFAIGLLLNSLFPAAIDIQSIVLGNALAISSFDALQVMIICTITLIVLCCKWRDFKAVFFDEIHARSIGIHTHTLKIIFFTLLSAATVATLQSVGACLVIAMVVTPGATAYLLTDRFDRLIMISLSIGFFTSAIGAYISFFLNAHPGALIVCFQTALFFSAFLAAPKYGLIRQRRAIKESLQNG